MYAALETAAVSGVAAVDVATVSTPEEFLAALLNPELEVLELARDIKLSAADTAGLQLPLHVSNRTLELTSVDNTRQTLDFGQLPRLLWLDAGSKLVIDTLAVKGEASRQDGVLTASWQINGSPLWPTVDGSPGHSVEFIDSDLTNAIDLCTKDIVQSEVANFRKYAKRNDTVFGEGLTLMFKDFSIAMPLSDIITKTPVGFAQYSLLNSNVTCIDDVGGSGSAAASGDAAAGSAGGGGGGTPGWVWAVVAVCAALVVAAVAAALLWRRRRRRRAVQLLPAIHKVESAEKGLGSGDKGLGSGLEFSEGTSSMGHTGSGALHSTMWKAKVGIIEGLQLGDLLGRGAFGRVYKGRWKGAQVAVKVVEQRICAGQEVDLSREPLLSMSMCIFRIATARSDPEGEPSPGSERQQHSGGSSSQQSGGGSSRMLPSLGNSGTLGEIMSAQDVLEPGLYETWLVCEYADRGSLSDAVAAGRFRAGEGGGLRDMVSILLCLLDVARGLEYLHSNGILHGDLKPANVLLKTQRSDRRGFVLLREQETHVDTQSFGTASHAAPELLMEGKLTKAADIYALALVMWECVCGAEVVGGQARAHKRTGGRAGGRGEGAAGHAAQQAKGGGRGAMQLTTIALFAGLAGALFGLDLGVISGALLQLQEDLALGTAGAQAVVGAAKLGAVFGTFAGGALMLRYGRRPAMAWNSAFFLVGPAVMAASVNVASRPPPCRGRVVSCYELLLCAGMLAAVLLDAALQGVANGWRWMLLVPIVPAMTFAGALWLLPESPRWLVVNGRLDKALAVIHRVVTSTRLAPGAQLSTAEVEAELLELWSSVEKDKHTAAERRRAYAEQQQHKGGAKAKGGQQRGKDSAAWTALHDAAEAGGLLPNSGTAASPAVGPPAGDEADAPLGRQQQEEVPIRTPEAVLELSGVRSHVQSTLFASAVGGAKLAGVALSFLLVDSLGRRPLLLWGSAGCAAALCGLVAADWAGANGAIVGGMCAFIFAFALSWAGVFWVLISELFSMSAKAPAAAAATATLFATSAAVDLLFLSIHAGLGPWAFLLFACVAAAGGTFLISGERLYPDLTAMQIIVHVTQDAGFRPPLPPAYPPALADLTRRCWQADPHARPDAAAVVEELTRIYSEYFRAGQASAAQLRGKREVEPDADAAASAAAAASISPSLDLSEGPSSSTGVQGHERLQPFGMKMEESARLYNPYDGLGAALDRRAHRGPAAFRVSQQPEFLFSEEALVHRRSWSENLTYYTGAGYLGGAVLGGVRGAGQALSAPVAIAGVESSQRLRLNQLLNTSGKLGRSAGNSLGVLGLLFASFESFIGYLADGQTPGELNTLAAGAATGALYRSVRGPRQAVAAAAVGAMAAGALLAGRRLINPGL
eukprot:scaffold2.g7343.t1